MINPRCLGPHPKMFPPSDLNAKRIRFQHILRDHAVDVVDLGEAVVELSTSWWELINGSAEIDLAVGCAENVFSV